MGGSQGRIRGGRERRDADVLFTRIHQSIAFPVPQNAGAEMPRLYLGVEKGIPGAIGAGKQMPESETRFRFCERFERKWDGVRGNK